MKGVILAGGEGSRLSPLTKVTNKHLLPVYDRPMIEYPIRTLVDAGIKEIMVVVSDPFGKDIVGYLKDGKHLGIRKLSFAFQQGCGGIAAALALAEDFADGGNIAVILGDNTTDSDIKPEVDGFWLKHLGAHVFLKSVPDPQRFGCPRYNCRGDIAEIIEKPKNPPSSDAVTGLYMYDHTVFDRIRKLEPSARGELEITDVNQMYIDEGLLTFSFLDGHWIDAGTPDSLFQASRHYYQKGQINA